MVDEAGENKGEIEGFLNTPSARESVKQILIARKTRQLLVDLAKGVTTEQTTVKEEQK